MNNLLSELSGADFSPCRVWRYALWRKWDGSPGLENCVAFLMLNPSKADEHKSDPTVTRCMGYARRWGYGGLLVLNLFAYRATDPADMKAAVDPVGPMNDQLLCHYAAQVNAIVAACGSDGAYKNRLETVKHLLGRRLDCLGLTKHGGFPRHPLYMGSAAQRVLYWEPPVVVR